MDKELENFQEINENMKSSSEEKKDYSEPNLIALGSMQRLTLAGGSANPDSGMGPGELI